MNKLNFIILIILILAIPLGLYLIRQQQVLKGRATGDSTIEFLGSGVNTNTNPPVTQTQSVQLRLVYNQSGSNNPPPPPPSANSGTDRCFFNLVDGQIISGAESTIITASRSNPGYFVSLQIVNSNLGSFQALSSQADTLFANLTTSSLFQNGSATLECRIQTDPDGGTIISSGSITVNVQN